MFALLTTAFTSTVSPTSAVLRPLTESVPVKATDSSAACPSSAAAICNPQKSMITANSIDIIFFIMRSPPGFICRERKLHCAGFLISLYVLPRLSGTQIAWSGPNKVTLRYLLCKLTVTLWLHRAFFR